MPPRAQVDRMCSESKKFLSEIQVDVSKKAFVIGLVGLLATFGDEALEVIKLGTSRPVKPNAEDAWRLIHEWEHSNTACCFQGPAIELISVDNRIPIAVSYKHLPKQEWFRHSKGEPEDYSNLQPGYSISKMPDEDRNTLVEAIVQLGEKLKVEHVLVWCDQILRTRLRSALEKDFRWFSIGVIPYMGMRQLHLSNHISKNVLDKRVWILVERSLATMCHGAFHFNDGIGPSKPLLYKLPTSHIAPGDTLPAIAQLIICGFWPEDKNNDWWNQDFIEMRKWALHIACRSNVDSMQPNIFFFPSGFNELKNPDLVAASVALSTTFVKIPGTEYSRYIKDPHFFLKAISWNIVLAEHWEDYPTTYISHYMGKIGRKYTFTWWKNEESGDLIGALTQNLGSIMIVAIKKTEGYMVYRTWIPTGEITHKEKVAKGKNMELFNKISQDLNIPFSKASKWNLFYFVLEDVEDEKVPPEIQIEFKHKVSSLDVLLPYIFRDQTTKLFSSRCFCLNSNAEIDVVRKDVAKEIFIITKEWNEYVKSNFTFFIPVRDSENGPVWLEGYDERSISFGFLNYLTQRFLCNSKDFRINPVIFQEKYNVLLEINSFCRSMEKDKHLIVGKLFDMANNDNIEDYITTEDQARFLLNGGFSSAMSHESFSLFLRSYCLKRNIWVGRIVCQNNVLQIRFYDKSENIRILQRSSNLRDFVAMGIVFPEDEVDLLQNSVPLNLSPFDIDWINYFHIGMQNTMNKNTTYSTFIHSRTQTPEGNKISLVDMSSGCEEMEHQITYVSAESIYGPSLVSNLDEDRSKYDTRYSIFRSKDAEKFLNYVGFYD